MTVSVLASSKRVGSGAPRAARAKGRGAARHGWRSGSASSLAGPDAAILQPKLMMGAPNGRFEHEADRFAEQVVRMPDPAASARAMAMALANNSVGGVTGQPVQSTASDSEAGNTRGPSLQRADGSSEKQEPGTGFKANFGHDFGRLSVLPRAAPMKRKPVQDIRRKAQTEAGSDRSAYGPGGTLASPDLGGMATMGLGCLFGLGGCRPDSGPELPSVEVGNFRNSGKTSMENKCPLCPQDLGVLAGQAHNAMELRGTISGHVPGAEYDFRRRLEGRYFLVGSDGAWWSFNEGPKSDDAANDDESLTPINGHIYVIDRPGNLDPQQPTDSGTGWVQKLNMYEWVEVRLGSSGDWTRRSDLFQWHSVVWLEKVDGVWRTNVERSEIAPGLINLKTEEP